jgi:hypothetical protein
MLSASTSTYMKKERNAGFQGPKDMTESKDAERHTNGRKMRYAEAAKVFGN